MDGNGVPVSQRLDLSHETASNDPIIKSEVEMSVGSKPWHAKLKVTTAGAVRTALSFLLVTLAACLAAACVIVVGVITKAPYEVIIEDVEVIGGAVLGLGLVGAPLVRFILRVQE
jgi:hypothetical protein